MSAIRFRYLSCLLLVLSGAAPLHAAERPLHNVVELVWQDCGDGTALQWQAHPERAAILSSGRWTIGDTGYRVELDALDDFRAWTMLTRLRDDARGVEDTYVLFSQTGLAPMEAAFVLTRLPPGMSDTAGIAAAAQMHTRELGTHEASWGRGRGRFGEVLESIVDNRTGSACYPTSQVFVSDEGPRTLGISRWWAHAGLLVESALIVPWPEGADRDAAVAAARSAMARFQDALQPAGADREAP